MMPDSTSDTGPPRSTSSRRRFLGTAAVGALAGIAGCLGETGRGSATPSNQQEPVVPDGPSVGLETVAEGFDQPTDFAVPSGSTKKFVLERAGQVFVVDANGKRDDAFLDITDRTTPVEGEQGLLGIAFHPEYTENRRFYLRYSEPPTEKTPKPYSHNEVLAEFRASDDGSSGDSSSERKLLEVPEPQSNHNGGAVTFGPEGYLYTSFGDGGKGNDAGTGHVEDWYDENEGGNGQDVSENFLGSVLRLDVDSRAGDKSYGIPDDNPLVGKPGLDEHFAWGFRNPWRMGFSNGRLYVADVGQAEYEEVDVVRKGGNYGWNVREGTHCFSPDGDTNGSSCPDSTPQSVRGGEALLGPVIEYPHTRDGQPVGKAVIGGYVYDGAVAALNGRYVFGEYYFGDSGVGALFAATPKSEGLWSFSKLDIATTDDGKLDGNLIAIGRDEDDELYALTAGESGGGVHKLVPRQDASGANATNATETTDGVGTATTAGATPPMNTPHSTNATKTTATDGETDTETSTNGPGFGVLAAFAGVAAGIGVRLLGERE